MIKIIQGLVNSKLRGFLLTAMLISLAVTGGMFAYAYTTASTSITAASKSDDFATVSSNVSPKSTVPDYDVFGSYRGIISSGYLFKVTTATDYPGDIELNVYLSNVDELTTNYGLFLLRLEFVDSSDNPADAEGIVKPLTMNNGVVTFICDNLTDSETYYVRCAGGVYRAFPWAFLSGRSIYDPNIYAEAVQAGL